MKQFPKIEKLKFQLKTMNGFGFGAPKCVNVGVFIDSFVKEHNSERNTSNMLNIYTLLNKSKFSFELRIKYNNVQHSWKFNWFRWPFASFLRSKPTKEWKSAHAQLHKNTNVSNNQNVK